MAAKVRAKVEQRQAVAEAAVPAEKQKPVWSMQYRTGSGWVEVAVFKHAVDHANGPFTTFSIALKRRYKDGEVYKSSQSFRSEDLLALAHGLTAAFAWISRQDRE